MRTAAQALEWTVNINGPAWFNFHQTLAGTTMPEPARNIEFSWLRAQLTCSLLRPAPALYKFGRIPPQQNLKSLRIFRIFGKQLLIQSHTWQLARHSTVRMLNNDTAFSSRRANISRTIAIKFQMPSNWNGIKKRRRVATKILPSGSLARSDFITVSHSAAIGCWAVPRYWTSL